MSSQAVSNSAAALTLPLLLDTLFAELDREGARYVVLHSYWDLPNSLPSDLDVAIAQDDLACVPAVIARLRDLGYRPVQCINYARNAYYFVFAWVEGGRVRSQAIDFVTEHREGGLVLLSADELVRGRRRQNAFWIPAPELEFRYLLSKKVLKGSIAERQAARMAELAAALDEKTRLDVARALFGSSYAATLVAAVLERRLDAEMATARKMFWRNVLLRQPWNPLLCQLSDLPRKLMRALSPTGVMVAVFGSDGSGKSTLINEFLQQSSGMFRRESLFHWRPMFLFGGRSGPVTNPHGRRSHSKTSSMAHAVAQWLDHVTGYWARVHPMVTRTGLVVFDRYYHDLAVDPERYRYAGPRWLPELLAKFVRRPDLTLVLDADPELVHARKQELSVAEIARQRGGYLRVARSLGGVVVDASQAPADVALKAVSRLVDLLARRFERRHSRWLTAPAGRGGAYLALPSADRPRWLVPVAGGRVPARSLDLYSPYRRTARMAKAAVNLAMHAPATLWGARFGVAEPACLETLRAICKRIFPGVDPLFSVSFGTPGRYRKLTIQIMDRQGRVLALAKTPAAPEARERVVNEALALAELRGVAFLRAHLPERLFAGEVAGTYFLVQSVLEGSVGGSRLSGAHRAFLNMLSREGITNRPAADIVQEIAEAWRAVAAKADDVMRAEVEPALASAHADAEGVMLGCGWSHGDFAPWNTRVAQGRLMVFDWESASRQRPFEWDAFHFDVQTAALLGRPSRLTVPRNHLSYRLYLLHSLCALLEEDTPDLRGIGYRIAELRKERG